MKISFRISLFLAILPGLMLAYIDSSPGWDDTGIEVFLLLAISGILSFTAKQKPWLVALAVSLWIPLSGMVFKGSFAGIVAFIPAFIGAYTGYLIGKNKTKLR